jgi:hypothetical protein
MVEVFSMWFYPVKGGQIGNSRLAEELEFEN